MGIASNNSIRSKLTMIIVSISLLAVCLTTAAITLIGYYNLRGDMVQELSQTAIMAGERNKSLLDYTEDPTIRRRAFVNLYNAFSTDPSITRVCLYDRNGEVFSVYSKDESMLSWMALHGDNAATNFSLEVDAMINRFSGQCPSSATEETLFSTNALHVMRHIKDDGRMLSNPFAQESRVGRSAAIYVESTLQKIDNYVRSQFVTAALVIVTLFVISLILAIKFQRGITAPILHLARTAQRVSHEKDYSARASLEDGLNSADELRTLVDSFNTMLIEIEDRDRNIRRKNVELEKAKVAAEEASVAKSQFMANISHELRTPLNAIIGFSSMMVTKVYGSIENPQYEEYANDIHESGTHLLEIINDILDLSKAEAGKLSLTLQEVHVSKAFDKCINILSERARAGSVTIEKQIPKNLPYLIADRVRFIQIMLNIISNAVKFTEPGGTVTISVKAEAASDEIAYFTFVIKDSGIGMSQEHVEKAFQSFGQVDSGLNRKYEGTGLGLPLTKKLVELHNASIDLQSEVGVGTTVTLRFISDMSLLD